MSEQIASQSIVGQTLNESFSEESLIKARDFSKLSSTKSQEIGKPSFIHTKAFVPLIDPDEISLEIEEEWAPQSVYMTKILIYEPNVSKRKVIRFVLFEQLKLGGHVKFFTCGESILQEIQNLYQQRGENQVAIVLVDAYNMPNLTGIELFKKTRSFMEDHGVREDHMPRFAFWA